MTNDDIRLQHAIIDELNNNIDQGHLAIRSNFI